MLKIELHRYHNLVYGRVLEQDENTRAKKPIENYEKASITFRDITLYSDDNFKIISSSFPFLSKNFLYVRGYDKRYNNHVFSYESESVKEAKKLEKTIKKSVKKYNETLERI